MPGFIPDSISYNQATSPDIAIPLNAFCNTAVLAVCAGDDKQLGGNLASERANECAAYTSASAFSKLRTDASYANHSLDTQYRCHPRIYEWINRTFYDGMVKSAPGLTDETAVDRAVKSFMSTELLHWPTTDYPRIIVIDVDQPSRPHAGSSSFWNPYEADVIEFLRRGLLGSVVDGSDFKLMPADFMILSPYKGQLQAIKDKSKVEQIQGQLVSTIATITDAQGAECPIGLSTFAKNDPDRPELIGFVSAPNMLNVWNSRQQRFHFIVGNFKGRANNLQGRGKEILKAHRYHATYIDMVTKMVDGGLPGVIVLQPNDFASWPGYTEPVVERANDTRAHEHGGRDARARGGSGRGSRGGVRGRGRGR